MDQIVVTGCEGQLGSELCRQLGAAAAGVDLPAFDLADPGRVREVLLALRPRAVVNTAAYVQVDKAEDEPELCWAANAESVACLAEVCRELRCPLVQISTDYVFGADAGRSTPYRETDPPGPLGAYGRSKLEGERRAARWEKHIIVRTCGLYGRPGPRSSGNFVETMLRLGSAGKPLRVVRDQHCTPSYVPHVARAVRFLLEGEHYGTYHVVNRGATTWFDFAAAIFRLAGVSVDLQPIPSSEYPTKAPRPAYSVLDTGKYHAIPGGTKIPFWEDALAEYLSSRT